MLTKCQKWGNSLGVRIPKSLAQEAKIEDGTALEVRFEKGRLVLTPVKVSEVNLQDLVDRITPENLHGEIDFGPPQGKEIW